MGPEIADSRSEWTRRATVPLACPPDALAVTAAGGGVLNAMLHVRRIYLGKP